MLPKPSLDIFVTKKIRGLKLQSIKTHKILNSQFNACGQTESKNKQMHKGF